MITVRKFAEQMKGIMEANLICCFKNKNFSHFYQFLKKHPVILTRVITHTTDPVFQDDVELMGG